MRDDIHRRLPLARAWKRVVKACVRDAEAPFRAPLLEQAARSELASLRLSVVEDAAEQLSSRQTSLFAADAFFAGVVAHSPIEAALQRECAAIAPQHLPPLDALSRALERALRERVAAILREIRAQLSIDVPQDCVAFVMRFSRAADDADLGTVARRHLAGEQVPPPRRLALDIDADLRAAP